MFSSESPWSLGANLPWIHYGGDFGANAWQPDGGLAATGVPPDVRSRIEQLREQGVVAVRWFLFCDGRAGVQFSDGGEPLGLDAHVSPDLDAAVTFASATGIQIVFVLFDFLWCAPRKASDGVHMRGHADVLADEGKRARLLQRVVAPVLERYAHHPAVGAWDVINEPEWAAPSVPADVMRAFITDVVALVHQTAAQPVTVGLASARGLDLVRNTAVDFYQVHWYDKLDRDAPLHRPVGHLGLGKPVVLGEFPTRGSRLPPDVILQMARDAGYAGAWFWSVQADDAASDPAAAYAALSGPQQRPLDR